jgi:hypothetical protein
VPNRHGARDIVTTPAQVGFEGWRAVEGGDTPRAFVATKCIPLDLAVASASCLVCTCTTCGGRMCVGDPPAYKHMVLVAIAAFG